MQVPFLSFSETNREIKREILTVFENFLDDSWYVLGERVKQFETEYAAFNQVNYCVGVSNGLDALQVALKTLHINAGDEVIIPANTYIATALAVSHAGATPVLIEPNIYTYNLDPDKIEAAITPKTKAIMPVHLYGQACEMAAIMAIAQQHQLFVIEDNAQAQGAAYNNQLTGSWGNINGTSFYPSKNLGAFGDAGAITTNNAELAHQVTILRNYGSSQKYLNEAIGYNMRLDECQAAFLSVKLKYLPTWTQQRQQIAAWYTEALWGVGDLILPIVVAGATHVYHLYVIRTAKRDALQKYLSGQNIGTLIHYPVPPHLQKAYQPLGYQKGNFPVTEELANTCLSLPLWPGLTQKEVNYVCERIKFFFAD